jgi:hypothetical protein
MTRRRKIGLLTATGATLLVAAAACWLWLDRGLTEARALAKHELWPDARPPLTRYLWLHPRDAQAHLLFAEALVKDEQLPAEQTIQQALAHLRAIPDESSEGARARMQEGRVELFLLFHATNAERLLRRAAELDPDSPEPYHLLWKLLDLTGRSHLAEPEFWKVYELSDAGAHALLLREWYMSQFYPATANPVLDLLMGVMVKPPADPSQTEAMRFIRFRNAEPESPLGYAALARWFQLQSEAKYGLETLEDAKAKAKNVDQDPFYLASLIGILIELGELDSADECFRKWPEPGTGYEYWLARGQILQEVRNEYAEAVKAYDLALRDWPGPVDWRTRNRKANCLARLQDREAATRERDLAKRIEDLMAEKVHKRLRFALGFLRDPEKLKELADFYQQIGRPREAACWSEETARLRVEAKPSASPGAEGKQ